MATIQFQYLDQGNTLKTTLNDSQTGLPLSIQGATTLLFKFKRPDGTTFHVPGLFATNGTDGVAAYEFADGDLNMVGLWFYQVYVVTPNFSLTSDEGRFKVKANVDAP